MPKSNSLVKKAFAFLLIFAAILVLTPNLLYKTQREGTIKAPQLQEAVEVIFDDYGVPHIQASNLDDLYFALGYLHAQDRLFQMESMRRLARGELAEVFGPELVKTDTLFRTLGLGRHAAQYVADADKTTNAWRAFEFYLAGVNHYQDTGKLPVEFDLLGITPRPFTTTDSISVAGYMAYSFAVAMRTEPLMSHVATELGQDYLDLFALDQPLNQVQPNAETLASLNKLGEISLLPQSLNQFEGSNAWAIRGSRTASGKPILESDPHITFGVPGTWYEAHLQAPGFEIYGHHLALIPPAMLGHNRHFGWGITMFQNDDMDFYLEKPNPDNPNQVWATDRWEDIVELRETIAVKDQDDVEISIRSTRNGPIINGIFPGYPDAEPVSLWWTFTNSNNPMLEAFYGMNHASNIEEFSQSVQGIHAPGLNIMYADASDNIGWWAAARIPVRPDHVSPWHILDGSSGKDSPTGFYDFSFNPQSVNPEAGFIVSANHRPQPQQQPQQGFMTPGYYNFDARAVRLTQLLENTQQATIENQRPLQLDTTSNHAREAMATLLSQLEADMDADLKQQLQSWDGNFLKESIAASVFIEWQYQLAEQVFKDELGEDLFGMMKETRKIDFGFYNILKNPQSPWWNNVDNADINGMKDVINHSWDKAIAVLNKDLGSDWQQWQWQRRHTLTLNHALSRAPLLSHLFSIGPAPVDGSHAVPNNLSQKFSSGEQPVIYGPSTRRLIDFAKPERSQGILPAGQSGNPFDQHYDDQFETYVRGGYRQQILDIDSIKGKQPLILMP
jgi:penicillin amidase